MHQETAEKIAREWRAAADFMEQDVEWVSETLARLLPALEVHAFADSDHLVGAVGKHLWVLEVEIGERGDAAGVNVRTLNLAVAPIELSAAERYANNSTSLRVEIAGTGLEHLVFSDTTESSTLALWQHLADV